MIWTRGLRGEGFHQTRPPTEVAYRDENEWAWFAAVTFEPSHDLIFIGCLTLSPRKKGTSSTSPQAEQKETENGEEISLENFEFWKF